MTDKELSGPWKPEMYAKYLPEEIAFDEGLIQAVIEFYLPSKSLDLGCGQGFYVRYLREKGVDAWGVEKEDLGEVFKSPGHLIRQDISQPFNLKEKYDLVQCLEVAEHIPRESEDIVFDNILRHMSKYLLFSGATVGQEGTGHINERRESHWFSHLVRRGLVLRHQESITIRQGCTLPWYAKNVSIWELVHPNSSADWASLVAERDSRVMTCEALLKEMRNESEETQSKLEQTRCELEQSQCQLKGAQDEGGELETQLEKIQAELIKAQDMICRMEASRFWKLRKKVLRVIHLFDFLAKQKSA
jgi:SAM-dependent methyltransferase